MSRMSLSVWLEVIGVISIIASLGLVAFQIRENTIAVSAQAVAGLNEETNEWMRMMASDSEFADIFTLGEADPESLSTTERAQLFTYCWSVGNTLETAHTYHRQGILDDVDYAS